MRPTCSRRWPAGDSPDCPMLAALPHTELGTLMETSSPTLSSMPSRIQVDAALISAAQNAKLISKNCIRLRIGNWLFS